MRTTAEENINELLENFMGINDAELGRKAKDNEDGEQNEKDEKNAKVKASEKRKIRWHPISEWTLCILRSCLSSPYIIDLQSISRRRHVTVLSTL